MKKLIFLILTLFVCFSGISFANSWEKNYISTLTKGKVSLKNTSYVGAGLGYHAAEEVILQDAIKTALDSQGPPCTVMKIAIDLEYNPYNIIKTIYSQGKEIPLDQLCMCATESGIQKQIITKAALDAVSSINKPVYSRDEIAQAQCFNERGLGYTVVFDVPPRIEPPPIPKPMSVSAPL